MVLIHYCSFRKFARVDFCRTRATAFAHVPPSLHSSLPFIQTRREEGWRRKERVRKKPFDGRSFRTVFLPPLSAAVVVRSSSSHFYANKQLSRAPAMLQYIAKVERRRRSEEDDDDGLLAPPSRPRLSFSRPDFSRLASPRPTVYPPSFHFPLLSSFSPWL